MNLTIMRFTAMSACLDAQKLVYVLMIGFVMPVAMKIISIIHDSSDSQTFEMLTGKVGVAFVLMVFCLGLAGNSSTQSGRGGEYLPLIFTRPITRAEYVFSKWMIIAVIGGVLCSLQNLVLAGIGFIFGEAISLQALLSMVIERFMDAGLISAAMILTMLNRNPAFQILSVVSFYIWLAGQTIPPVSIAGSAGEIAEVSIEATKLLVSGSHYIADLILPTVNVYDLISAPDLTIAPVIAYLSALALYLTLSVSVTNRREFFYGTN